MSSRRRDRDANSRRRWKTRRAASRPPSVNVCSTGLYSTSSRDLAYRVTRAGLAYASSGNARVVCVVWYALIASPHEAYSGSELANCLRPIEAAELSLEQTAQRFTFTPASNFFGATPLLLAALLSSAVGCRRKLRVRT